MGWLIATIVRESGADGPPERVCGALLSLSMYAAGATAGEANVRIALTHLGLEEWLLSGSALLLAGRGLWIHRHRRGNLWLLLGVTAIVARFWTYHRWYDDVLLLLLMIALFRLAKRVRSPDGSDVIAGGLLAVTLLSTLAPGGLYLFPPPWNAVYVIGQVVVWIAVLVFLLDCARRERLARMEVTAE